MNIYWFRNCHNVSRDETKESCKTREMMEIDYDMRVTSLPLLDIGFHPRDIFNFISVGK